MAASEDDMQRLATVIERQRRELERMHATAADESIVATARGVLMERLGLSQGQAASQLDELAAATGVPLAEMAAAVLSPDVSADRPTDVVHPPRSGEPPGRPSSLADAAAELAAELAADGAGLADALAAQLASLGASAVALWLLEADGALALLGAVGLPGDETSRWRHIPPQLDCPAQRVAHGAADLWWNAGLPARDTVPVPGRPTGARVVLALRERNGALLGVMEAIWPEVVTEFGTETRQRLSSLAAGCAPVIGTRLAHGDLAAARPRPAVYTLLDSLADSVLVAQAIRDTAGQLTDFCIEHVSPGFSDPEGRSSAEVAGLTLLEAYPASVSGRGLFALARQVLADGVPQHVPGPGSLSGASEPPVSEGRAGADQALLADLRMARFFDGVIVTWHRLSVDDSMVTLLDHAQRLGRLGGWEEDLITGTVLWTDSAFELFGLAPRSGAGIPLADLHSYVMAADKPVVKRLRDNLAGQREALTATFRFVHPDDRSVRQIRVFAEPVLDAGGTTVALRGAFQDVSAHYHMQVALAATREQLADSEQRMAEEHRLAVRLQQAIMPPGDEPVAPAGIDVAVRYRPAARATWWAATGTTRCCCRVRTSSSWSETSRGTASTR